jgi:hypothetical protein
MKIVVFAGPTLTADEVRQELEAEVLPPVVQGDVLRAVRQRCDAIGMIDGSFDRVPAVWHKEILWAISKGVMVFGAASMGALRAVELAPFGMIGVGKVFQQFHSGALEDDDEVAVAHAAADQKFRVLSDALVNIRATVAAAVRAGVLSESTGSELVRCAKALPYPERAYSRLLGAGASLGLDPRELGAFEGWLPRGAINQKRLDALDMLRAMRQILADGKPDLAVDFTFAHTEAWEAACVRDLETARTTEGTSARDLLDEVRISGEYAGTVDAALSRALSLWLAPKLGGRAHGRGITDASAAFCEERGLRDQDDLRGWLERMDVALDGREQFFGDLADVRRVRRLFGTQIIAYLADTLRERDLYRQCVLRAKEKRTLLREFADDPMEPGDVGLVEGEVWPRYFREVLQMGVPADVTVFARAAGFSELETFRQAALRELCYRQRRTIPAIPS